MPPKGVGFTDPLSGTLNAANCGARTRRGGVSGMTVGHALQDVLEPDKWLDVVELCGGDEGADGCPSDRVQPRALSHASSGTVRVRYPIAARLLCKARIWQCRLLEYLSFIRFAELRTPTLARRSL
jgi:hypothetical protein